MIIGLTGLAQSGKDTVASFLVENHGFERRAFADKLKQFAVYINPTLATHVGILGWEQAKKLPEHRKFLQDVGHGAREFFGETIWTDQVLNSKHITSENIVISDMRYENEFSLVKNNDGMLVRIIRSDIELVNNHITEVGHLNWPVDWTIYNDGSLEDLKIAVDEMIFGRSGRYELY